MAVERTKITYRNGAYYVDRPNWDGGEVVTYSDYAALEVENAALKEALAEAAGILEDIAEPAKVDMSVSAPTLWARAIAAARRARALTQDGRAG